MPVEGAIGYSEPDVGRGERVTRVLVVALFFLASCLGWKGWRQELHSFSGEDVTGLIEWLGVPDKQLVVPSGGGRVMYTWLIHSQGGNHMCDVTVTVDESTGRVLRIKDDCPDWR